VELLREDHVKEATIVIYLTGAHRELVKKLIDREAKAMTGFVLTPQELVEDLIFRAYRKGKGFV